MEKKETKIAENYLYNLLYQIFVILVPLITAPYISRILGADNIGIYSYTLSVSTYFIVAGNLGFPLYGQREIAYHSQNEEARSRLFFEIASIRCITVSIALLLYVGVIIFVAKDNKEIFFIQSIGIIANIIDMSWLFQGLEEFRITVIRNIFIKLLSVAGLFIFVKTYHDLPVYTLIICVSNLLGNGFLLVDLRRHIKFNHSKVVFSNFSSHIRAAVVLGIPYYITSFYAIIDKTMIGTICERYSEVGYYEQSQKIVTFALAIVTSLGTVFMPRLAKEYQNKNVGNISKYLNTGIEIVELLAFPIFIGMFVLGKMIVPWFFGKGYERVGDLILIFAPLIVIMGVGNFIGNQYLVAAKKEKCLTITIAVGIVLNLVFNALLIPHFASCGAAVATIISEIVKLMIQIIISKDMISIKKFIWNGGRYGVDAMIMGIVLYIVKQNILTEPTFINTVMLVVLGIIVYLTILVFTKNVFILKGLEGLRGIRKRKRK